MVLIPIIDFEKERTTFLESVEMKKILDTLDEEEMKLEGI